MAQAYQQVEASCLLQSKGARLSAANQPASAVSRVLEHHVIFAFSGFEGHSKRPMAFLWKTVRGNGVVPWTDGFSGHALANTPPAEKKKNHEKQAKGKGAARGGNCKYNCRS